MSAEPVKVHWQISSDEAMKNIIREGDEVASSDWAHSVHVELRGLESNRPYWYRFQAGDAISPIGRARTTPKAGDKVDRLQFAFASCQHFETGYYYAYKDMVEHQQDLIVHLGDYIYEGAATKDKVRAHIGPELNSTRGVSQSVCAL